MATSVHELGHEKAHEAANSHHSTHRRIGLLISVLALCLAIAEIQGKASQTNALALNVEAANLWTFFQAKTIRQTTLRTAAEQLRLAPEGASPDGQKQLTDWRATIDRWETEPSTNEGRKELMQRARTAEIERDRQFARYHALEYVSLLFQLAIVIASVALIADMIAFAFAGMVLGGVGAVALFGVLAGWTWVLNAFHLIH
jgi:hypothetical protein